MAAAVPSTADVEMTDAKSEVSVDKEKEILTLLLADLKSSVNDLERTASSKELRFVARVIRQLRTIRKRLNEQALTRFLHNTLGSGNGLDVSSYKTTSPSVVPEVVIFAHLLVIIYYIDNKKNTEALNAASALINWIQSSGAVQPGRRTASPLIARAYFYYSLAAQRTNTLTKIRNVLHNAFRTAVLSHDDELQATLINLLLHSYISFNLYDLADKLLQSAPFPETHVSNAQHARYLYFTGRVRAMQLKYTEASELLQHAVRKAPTRGAVGFRLEAQRLLVIVQLLTGEIPERSVFRTPGLVSGLVPYSKLTHAVNVGELELFRNVVNAHADQFKRDATYSLVARLRHNVIKAGLRKIALAYSRISLTDIASKLRLDSASDAEFIVAKAIRDGVIDAHINHEEQYVQSHMQTDTYATQEPLEAFNKRVEFCLNIHNDAVRAMRFPHSTQYEADEAARERQKQEAELANELEKEDTDSSFED